jgi:hypothetical protein
VNVLLDKLITKKESAGKFEEISPVHAKPLHAECIFTLSCLRFLKEDQISVVYFFENAWARGEPNRGEENRDALFTPGSQAGPS